MGSLIVTADGAEHTLNATAFAVWQLCDGATQPDEMVGALGEFFDVTLDEIDVAVGRTLGDLADAGLVTWDGI